MIRYTTVQHSHIHLSSTDQVGLES